jgi:hypothetical protein
MVIQAVNVTSDGWRMWRELRLDALAEAPGAFGATLAEWSGAGDTEQRWRARIESVALKFRLGDSSNIGELAPLSSSTTRAARTFYASRSEPMAACSKVLWRLPTLWKLIASSTEQGAVMTKSESSSRSFVTRATAERTSSK